MTSKRMAVLLVSCFLVWIANAAVIVTDSVNSLSSWNPSCSGCEISQATSSNAYCNSNCILISCCNNNVRSISKSFNFGGAYESISIEAMIGSRRWPGSNWEIYVRCNGNWYRVVTVINLSGSVADSGPSLFTQTVTPSPTRSECDGVSSMEVRFDISFPTSSPGSDDKWAISNFQLTGNPLFTPNPTKKPTKKPTPKPTPKPTKKPTMKPTKSPTKSPTFSKQECEEIYIIQQELNDYYRISNATNVSLADLIFTIYDYVGINDHLYWDVNNDNNIYRMYYDSSWIIKINSIRYKYISNDNSTSISEAAGYPRLDELTSWFLLNNNDINDVNMNNSIQLYLSCNNASLEINPSGSDDSDKETFHEYLSYIIIGSILLIAIVLDIIAFFYHRKKLPGSDRPGYMSVIRCSIEVADMYTDISFVYALYLNGDSLLWYLIPILFISVAYILSICTVIYKTNAFKKHKEKVVNEYMNKYDKGWILITLLFGFYATFDLLTSHLFHLGIMSFQISKSETNNVKTLRIINFVLIENLGMLIFQIIYLSYIGYFNVIAVNDGDIPSEVRLTLLSMIFSIISIIGGLLAVISRLLHCCSSSYRSNDVEYFYMDIKSKHMNQIHTHSHFLIVLAISKATGIDKTSIETLTIITKKENGIHCKIMINICDDHDLQNYEKLFSVLSATSDTIKSLKNELKLLLKLPAKKKLDVSLQKIKRKKSKSKDKKNTQNKNQIKMSILSSKSNDEQKSKSKSKPKKKQKNRQ